VQRIDARGLIHQTALEGKGCFEMVAGLKQFARLVQPLAEPPQSSSGALNGNLRHRALRLSNV